MKTEASEYLSLLQEIQNNNVSTFTVMPADEPRFTIETNSRNIIVPSEFSFLSVQNDHRAETIYFEIDRYFDNVDLSQHTCVVQFINKSGTTINEGTYPVTSMDIDSVDGKIVFGWEIRNDATQLTGDITFSVRFYSIDNNGNFTYNFNTLTASSYILPSLNIIASGERITATELEVWTDKMNNLASSIESDIITVEEKIEELENYIASIPEDYTALTEEVSKLSSDLSDILESGKTRFKTDLFEIGFIAQGANQNNYKRVRFKNIMHNSRPLNLSVTQGFRYLVDFYGSDSVSDFIDNTKWITDKYEIKANSYFRVAISTVDDSVTVTNVGLEYFVENLSINSFLLDLANTTQDRLSGDEVIIQQNKTDCENLSFLRKNLKEELQIDKPKITLGKSLEITGSDKTVKYNNNHVRCVTSLVRTYGAEYISVDVKSGYRCLLVALEKDFDISTSSPYVRSSGTKTVSFTMLVNDASYIVYSFYRSDNVPITEEELDAITITLVNTSPHTPFSHVTEYIEEEDSLIEKVRNNIDDKTLVFGLSTDNHYSDVFTNQYGVNQLYYGENMRKICESVGVEFIANLGDIVDGDKSLVINIGQMQKIARVYKGYLPFVYTIGHHEMMPMVNSGNWNEFSVQQSVVRQIFMRDMKYLDVTFINAEHTQTSYYIDFEDRNTRLISLDSVSWGQCGFATEVVTFLREALNSANGKNIIVFSHCATSKNTNGSNVTNGAEVELLLTEYNGVVLGHFHGHTHFDNVVNVNGKYNLISTCCMQTRNNGEISDVITGNPMRYDRENDTYSAYCFDIVCVHTDTGKVNTFRFGVGNDRVIN